MNRLLQTAVISIAIMLLNSTASASGSGDHSHKHEHEKSGDFSVGEPATGKPDRVIDVTMLDTMRFEFSPAFDDLHDGDVIAFNIKNVGTIVHEFSIGNAEDQIAHAKMMRSMPDMKHVDPNTLSLEPGKSGKIVWHFKGDETVVFACNEVGHFEAGMRHDIEISPGH